MKELEEEFVEIDRVVFKEVNDDELYIINRFKTERSMQKFGTRMLISAVVILFVFAFQVAGDVLKEYSANYVVKHMDIVADASKKYILLMVAAFIVYNAISYFCLFVKRQLVCLTENYYILSDAVVTDRYLGKKLALEGKERKKNYVVFKCDQGICSKAIEANKKQYMKTNVGDKIVILKSVTVEGYKLNYLKEDEYRNFYDARIKNS